MKTIGLILALSLFAGCKKGGSAASNCSEAVGKGVDKMIALRKDKMDQAQMPPEMKAKMEERAKKMDEVAGALKQAITNRCTEDKWPDDVVKCYGNAGSMEELRGCREKLPADQQAKLKNEEMQVMMKSMGGAGGMPGAHSMGGPGGEAGGAMGGAGSPPAPADQNGAPPAVPPTGSAAPAPTGSAAAGSAK